MKITMRLNSYPISANILRRAMEDEPNIICITKQASITLKFSTKFQIFFGKANVLLQAFSDKNIKIKEKKKKREMH